MTPLRSIAARNALQELKRRGHEIPRSVEHLLNEAGNRGIKVHLAFREDGHPDPDVKDCFTLVYGVEPHGFTCKPTLKAFRKALAAYNNQDNLPAKRKIALTLTPRQIKQLQAFGSEIRSGPHVISNDGGQLHVQSSLDSHVLAVPQFGKGKVPRAVLRAIIGMMPTPHARRRASNSPATRRAKSRRFWVPKACTKITTSTRKPCGTTRWSDSTTEKDMPS